MYKTLGNFVDSICNHYQNREFLYFPTTNTTYTYSSFHNLVTNMCNLLINQDLKKGDYLTLKSNNRPEWIAIEWAAFKLGIVIVSLNSNLTYNEVNNSMEQTGSKFLITDDTTISSKNNPNYTTMLFSDIVDSLSSTDSNSNIDYLEIKKRQKEVVSTDVALILFTSGTTSAPKAVVMKHKSILSAILDFITCVTYKKDDNALICAPFSHMMGALYGILSVISFGGKITLLESFKTKRVLENISKEHCSIFFGVPTMYLFLLNKYKDYDISSLRTGIIAGSNVSPDLYKRIYNELGMTELLQSFGQTEVLAVTMTNMKDSFEKRAGSAGKPLESVQIKIVDIATGEKLANNEEGEILVQADYLMKGYLNNEEATLQAVDEEGWIHTGDLGYLDDEGYLYVKSRIKDVIIRGGENISPYEIEDALLKLPEIKDASVMGVPDPLKSEEICAFIIPNDEVDIDVDMIQAKLSEIIAKYKIPKYILSINSFPKTSSNKIAKNKLKQAAIDHINNMYSAV